MKKIFIALMLISLFSSFSLFAQIYVSKNGNDSNDGSINSPFATIQHALYAAQAGDTIYVMAGEYNERLYWPVSGSEGNPVVLTNYQDDQVAIDGDNATNSSQNELLAINSHSHIVIDGLIFRDNIRNDAGGIYYVGSGSDIAIRNCEFYNIGWTNDPSQTPSSSDNAHAILFVGSQANSISNILIENNYIHDCIPGYSEALTLNGNIDGFTIQNNKIENITNIGMDIAGHWSWTGAPADVNYSRNGTVRDNQVINCNSTYSTSAGIYTDGAENVVIENNTLVGNDVGVSVGIENAGTVSNITVRNNIFYNNKEAGIYFGGSFANSGVVQNSYMIGNTLYYNDMGHSLSDWTGEIVLNRNKDCQIFDNIIYPRDNENKKVIVAINNGTTNISVDYNLYWRQSGDVNYLYDWGTGNTYSVGNNNITQDPLFKDPANYDFHLTAQSPAINAGNPNYTPVSGEKDMDGQNRVINGRVDIGADEYSATTTLVATVENSFIKIYPDPVESYLTVKSDKNISRLTVLTLTGQKVIEKHLLNSNDILIDVKDLPSGIYVLHLKGKDFEKSINFIKH